LDREAYRRNLLWRLADAASKCARNRVEGFELLRQASACLHRLHPDHVVMTAQELEANFRVHWRPGCQMIFAGNSPVCSSPPPMPLRLSLKQVKISSGYSFSGVPNH